ncbi:DUF7503 family protein [Halospeciosus flavus]|uniref:MFS transporter n=1 Tax=Halospeciosus flavus TaxID=3032283 RepID=A0ABD5Z442_9EURY|nr:hypothetical protein [Halospeciosus flavus]
MSDTSIQSHLTENPRAVGVLFTVAVLLSQAGNVAGAAATTISGP